MPRHGRWGLVVALLFLGLAACQGAEPEQSELCPGGALQKETPQACRMLAAEICGAAGVSRGARLLCSEEWPEDAMSLEQARALRATERHVEFGGGVAQGEGQYCSFLCNADPAQDAGLCQGDEDCPEGLFCELGICVLWDLCEEDAQCPGEQRCRDGICVDICDSLGDCGVIDERKPRWCQGNVAGAIVRNGLCDEEAALCDMSQISAQVDCGRKGQSCIVDRCLSPEAPLPEIDDDLELILPGSFVMGSGADSQDEGSVRGQDEGQHRVELSHGFWIQRTEVSQGQWFARMRELPPEQRSCGADCAAGGVSWWDALAYTNALSRSQGFAPCFSLQGCNAQPFGDGFACQGFAVNAPGGDPYQCEGYRLPTEAEWEYAARAGTQGAFWHGPLVQAGCQEQDQGLSEVGWYGANSMSAHVGAVDMPECGQRGDLFGLQPVAQRMANPWGLYDMHGNVAEWTLDSYQAQLEDGADPWVRGEEGQERVLRGGGWASVAQECRAAAREKAGPQERLPWAGLRVVRTARPEVSCRQDEDCPQGSCQEGRCYDAHCENGLWDQGLETGVDCGLGCGPCVTGGACLSSRDCAPEDHCDRGRCTPDHFAFVPAGSVTPGLDQALATGQPPPLDTLVQPRPLWVLRHEFLNEWANELRGEEYSPFRNGERPVRAARNKLEWEHGMQLANLVSLREGLEPCYLRPGSWELYDRPIGEGAWPGEQDCLGYRLPFVTEWQYLARSGSTYNGLLGDITPNGPEMHLVAWTSYNAYGTPHLVQQKLPNFWNIYDLQGNSAEMTWMRSRGELRAQGGYWGEVNPSFSQFGRQNGYRAQIDHHHALHLDLNPRLVRTLPERIQCAGCLDHACQEEPRRRWLGNRVSSISAGPGGGVLIEELGQRRLLYQAWERYGAPGWLSQVVSAGAGTAVLTQSGELLYTGSCQEGERAWRRLAQSVVQVQWHQEALFWLTQGGELLRWDSSTQEAALVRGALRAFALSGEGLWSLDAEGQLWREARLGEEPRLERSGVEQLAGGEGGAFWSTELGCLWRHDGQEATSVDAQVRGFALSGPQIYALHRDERLYALHSPGLSCAAPGCQAAHEEALWACIAQAQEVP